MDVFRHHLYEYWKGLRHLILHTAPNEQMTQIEHLLKKNNVAYLITPLSTGHFNVFFGDQACLDVIRSFGLKKLSDYTDEQDFILGIMLGYDRRIQCERYLQRRKFAKDTEDMLLA